MFRSRKARIAPNEFREASAPPVRRRLPRRAEEPGAAEEEDDRQCRSRRGTSSKSESRCGDGIRGPRDSRRDGRRRRRAIRRRHNAGRDAAPARNSQRRAKPSNAQPSVIHSRSNWIGKMRLTKNSAAPACQARRASPEAGTHLSFLHQEEACRPRTGTTKAAGINPLRRSGKCRADDFVDQPEMQRPGKRADGPGQRLALFRREKRIAEEEQEKPELPAKGERAVTAA